jgi:hypothetical protein
LHVLGTAASVRSEPGSNSQVESLITAKNHSKKRSFFDFCDKLQKNNFSTPHHQQHQQCQRALQQLCGDCLSVKPALFLVSGDVRYMQIG